MKTNFSMLFYLKKQKDYLVGVAPIYLRITVDGKRAEITTNRSCEPDKWNSDAGRVIGTKESTKSINSCFEEIYTGRREFFTHVFLTDIHIVDLVKVGSKVGQTRISHIAFIK